MDYSPFIMIIKQIFEIFLTKNKTLCMDKIIPSKRLRSDVWMNRITIVANDCALMLCFIPIT